MRAWLTDGEYLYIHGSFKKFGELYQKKIQYKQINYIGFYMIPVLHNTTVGEPQNRIFSGAVSRIGGQLFHSAQEIGRFPQKCPKSTIWIWPPEPQKDPLGLQTVKIPQEKFEIDPKNGQKPPNSNLNLWHKDGQKPQGQISVRYPNDG
jgi:hypothetical protein